MIIFCMSLSYEIKTPTPANDIAIMQQHGFELKEITIVNTSKARYHLLFGNDEIKVV